MKTATLAESSTEGYGSKRAVLPTMLMLMPMIFYLEVQLWQA
jgi:hypothetical protein